MRLELRTGSRRLRGEGRSGAIQWELVRTRPRPLVTGSRLQEDTHRLLGHHKWWHCTPPEGNTG